MELPTPQVADQYAALVASAETLVVGLDFDGTLAPIVDDPTQAHIHPDAPDLLLELAKRVRGIAVVTGRPARQALALGDLDVLGARVAELGKEFHVLGQYGNERWTSTERRVISPRPPHGLASFVREVPTLLRRAQAPDAYVELKGLAVALHTRRLPDPQGSFSRMLPLIEQAAERHGLSVEPGRLVVEVRAPGMHKGLAVRTLADRLEAGAFLFAGDDLGDVEAFDELRTMRKEGTPTLIVCSDGGDGPDVLAELADVVVQGPDGVMDVIRDLLRDIDGHRSGTS
ncbi:trehalose-phosphatase [Nocardioides campestrisoli]|uniref:trehalose-phosphatase n=1 Tax=Nocardioides campestrisoli TaxID=2736757 RepID=UPI00163DCCB7|nr:trehalose-phosphatase [Nocardioides campestrisoli]